MKHALYTTSSVFSALFILILIVLVFAGVVHGAEISAITATTTPATILSTIPITTLAPTCIAIPSNLGQSMRDVEENGSIKKLQRFLKDSSYLEVEPTGYFGELTKNAVKKFQKENGVPSTGYVGMLTRKAFERMHCRPHDDGNTEAYSNANPNLSFSVTTEKVSYTQTDDINFTITAKNISKADQTLQWTSGCPVSFNIGPYDSRKDQICTLALATLVLKSGESKTWTATYIHGTYPFTPGDYRVIGRVNTIGEAHTQISLTGPTRTSSLSVVTPNGNEVWYKNQKQNISWRYSNPVFSGHDRLDITLEPYVPACQGVCPMYMLMIKSYTLGIDVPAASSTFSWLVGSTLDLDRTIPEGMYRIQICVSHTDVCDVSDQPFRLSTIIPATNSSSINGQ
jgi:peptidoglycan hydrolase-like protein with peptidoglycan-binding domain